MNKINRRLFLLACALYGAMVGVAAVIIRNALRWNTTEQKSKHTPGPWKIEETSAGGAFVDVVGEDGWLVAEIEPNNQNVEANARLIAAAPELLRCLVRLEIAFAGRPTADDEAFWDAWADLPGITTREVQQSCLNAARAAIDEATGE